MLVRLVSKTSTPHTLWFVQKGDFKKLPDTLRSFVSQELSIDKGGHFKVGMLPLVDKKQTTYHIVCILDDAKNCSPYLEDIVAEVGGLIKKVNKVFACNLDTSPLSKNDIHMLVELLAVNLYAFTKYKPSKKINYALDIQTKRLDTKHIQTLQESMTFVRDLVNDPSHSVHPETVEQEVKKIFGKNKNIKITIFKGEQLVQKKMMGIYNVGKGSQHAPRLILLEYKGSNKKGRDVALIGKGVCFDSGGYNIKPTGSMEEMKVDMTGSATVLGILRYAMNNKRKKNIVVGIPVVENLISGNAFKPGEVITMYNGKTVEVGNTDAEGRLILADTLSYVEEKYKPSYAFDFATLTGAQVIALGHKFSAIIGRNPKLNQKIQDLSLSLKDRVWELPFFEPYFASYKSEIADMNNISSQGRMGPGTITAGLFLSQFIGMKNWAHFDIAGPAYVPGDAVSGGGATACMLRLMIHVIENEL